MGIDPAANRQNGRGWPVGEVLRRVVTHIGNLWQGVWVGDHIFTLPGKRVWTET
jgi:hypothetical protein